MLSTRLAHTGVLWQLQGDLSSSWRVPGQGRPPGAFSPVLWTGGALSPATGMSRQRPRGEALASCLLWEIPRKEQSPGLGRGVVGARRVAQRLCNRHSAPESGNPRRLHPATPTAGKNSVAGEVWERGQRAPPTTTSWQPSGVPGPFQRPGQLRRSPLKGQPWPHAGGWRSGWWYPTRSVPGTAAAFSPQEPVCPDSPGPEAPSDQAALGTGA